MAFIDPDTVSQGSRFVDPDLADTAMSSKPATPPIDFSKIDEPGFVDKVALGADKIFKQLGSVLPDFLPTRQQLVNVAAGASEAGGLFHNAPRLQNVRDDSGGQLIGQLLDPVANVAGGKVFQAIRALPQLQRARPLVRDALAGAAAGGTIGTASGVGEAVKTGDMDAIPDRALSGAALGGTMAGAVIPAAVGTIQGMYNTGQRLAGGAQGQATNYLRRLFPNVDDRTAVVNELNRVGPIVPGERVTAGTAAVSGNRTFGALKTLEEDARKLPEFTDQFNAIDRASQVARMNPLEAIASPARKGIADQGGRVPLSRVEAVRKSITEPMYVTAGNEMVNVDDGLQNILRGPEIQNMVTSGNRSFQQAIVNAIGDGQPGPSGRVAGRITQGIDLPEWSVAGPRTPNIVEPSQTSINHLQRIKASLDQEVTRLRNADGADALRRDQINEARRQLVQWMENNSPAYRNAQETFRFLSEPQNQGDIAEQLRFALESPAGKERVTALLNARRNVPQVLNKAGVPRFQQIEQVMSPTQMRWIDQLGRSAQREADYIALKKPDLPTDKSVMTHMKQALPEFINKWVSVGRKALRLGGDITNTEAERIINRAIMDPRELARLISSVPPEERSQFMNHAFRVLNGQTTRGTATTGAVNISE